MQERWPWWKRSEICQDAGREPKKSQIFSVQAKSCSYSCKQNFSETTANILQRPAPLAARSLKQPHAPFIGQGSRSCLGDRFGPPRVSLQGTQAQVQQRALDQRVPGGTRLPDSEPQHRCQVSLRASCLVVAGEAFPAASQTACSRLARGWTLRWLQQLGRSVCRGEIKMGKHGRSHQPKEISTRARHTNNHCSFMAPWKAARAVVSRSFCHICNTR